jgi:hypothetical protein
MSSDEAARARTCSADEIEPSLAGASEQTLDALLENPCLDETHVCRLLERKDLSTTLLERISARKEWLRNRRVRLRLVAHPHTPRRIALRLAREIYPLELVAVSLSLAAPAEIRRFVEDLLLSRLPQLPLGQKLALARRGSARVAGALLTDGHERVARVAVENARLTEAQVLRVLAAAALSPSVIGIIGVHAKWSPLTTVRAAIVRHPRAPLDLAFSLVPLLPLRDLEDFAGLTELRPELRDAIRKHRDGRASGPNPRRSER